MRIADKTDKQLIEELEAARLRVAELERAETERKQVEDGLGQSKEQFQTLLDEAPIGICNTDLKGKITYVNKRFEEVSGYSRQEVVGKNGFKLGFFSAETVGLLVKRMAERLRGRPYRLLEIQFRCKDGHWIWVALEGKILREKGIPIGFQLISRDITERKRAEETLRQSNRRFKDITKNALEWVWEVDAEGKYTYTSPVVEKILGYKPEEILKKTFYELFHPDDREELKKAAFEVFAKKQPFRQFINRNLHKSGKIVWLSTSGVPILDEVGNFLGYRGADVDITERKQAEEALQAEKNKLQSVINAMEDGLTMQDRDYNIIYQNKPLKGLFGDCVGKKCYRVYGDGDNVCDGCPVKKAFKDGKSHTSVRRVVLTSGEVAFWETTTNPIRDAKGQIISCLEIVRNITERKQAEEALQAEKNKLQSVINSLKYGLTIQDKDYNIIYQNEPSRIASGGDRVGEKCYRVYGYRGKVCNGCPVKMAFEDGRSHTVERKQVAPSGEVNFWENTASPIRDAKGEIVSCLEITRKITERKQAEEALRESENKYRTIFENASDVIARLDKRGKVIDANQRIEDCFGYKPEEVIGKNFAKLGVLSLKDLPKMAKLFKEAAKGKPLPTTELGIKRKDGSTAQLEVSTTLVKKDGKIDGVVVLIRDITERKQAEQALADEATRRRILVEQSSDGIVVLDESGKVYEANQKFAEMLGYTPEEVRELHVWDWDTQFPREQLLEMVRSVDETGDHFETYHRRKDGTVYDVEISTNGAVIAGQKLIFCVCRDITERKQVDEALQAEKNKLQSVINAMEDGLTIQDRDYNIIYQNELVRKLFGDRVGEKCYRVYEGREDLCDGCPVKKAFKDGKSHTSERRVVLPSGEITFWENTANPIRNAKGKIVSCLEINRNITERKKQEQALADEATRRRILVEQSSDGIVVLDEDGKVYEANQRFAEMLGYTPEEVRELHVWDWEAEFPRERVAEMIESIGPEGAHFETRHRRKDGTVYDVGISTNGAVIAGQKLIFCVCRDITERKQAEEKLKESEEKYKTLAEDIPVGVYFSDFAGKFLYGNKKSEEIVGYKRRELLGKNFLKLKMLDSKGIAKAIKLLALNKLGRATGPDEFVLTKKDGAKRTVEIRTRIATVGGKKVVLGMAEDITERKQTQEALRDSEEKLRKMFESATDGISVIDLNGVITEVNREMVEMHGFSSRNELVGRSALEIVAPRDHERVTANMHKALKQGTVKGEEYTLLKADGSEFPGELSTSTLKDADGKLVGHITISRDITERKQAEQALIEAEEKYKNLVESVSDMIWETDEEGTFTFVSPRIKDTLGYEVDEVVGKRRTLDFTPKGEAQKWLRRFAEINAKRKSFSGFEITHIHKNGNPVIFETSGTPFFDSNGDFKGFVGINKDITERKQAEEEIERQRAYFQQLFDNSPEGIALLDSADRFVQVNRGFENLFGYRSEELKGRSINEVIVPEGLGEEATALSQSALDNQIRRKETVRKRKDGSLVDVDAIGYPIQFDNQTVGVYAIYSDITERKQSEQALRESQEFSSSLLENSPNPEFVVNPDTSIKYVNPAFEKLTGFSLDEITGIKAPYPWWPTEKREETTAGFKNAMVTGGRRSERVFRKKNGEHFWVVINSAPVMHEGKLIYFIVNWLDITERKQAEEERLELEQKAHLASRLASVGEMAAGIAHEINNPMTAVIGFSQLLMDTELPKDIEEDITVIHKEAQRAASVARNLLTFARKHAPTKQLTNINSIIEGVLKLRAYEQSVSNIRVNTRLAPDLPEVMVDHSQLQQVFINIILNAEAAMLESSKGGTLTVTTQRVNDTVRASFTDSGRGIAKENLNRIFDPFFTTKEVGKGTGLGLSVCHGILAEHGGRIYARSRPGQGATFVVELPVNSRSDAGSN